LKVIIEFQDLAASFDNEDVANFTQVVKEFESITHLVYLYPPNYYIQLFHFLKLLLPSTCQCRRVWCLCQSRFHLLAIITSCATFGVLFLIEWSFSNLQEVAKNMFSVISRDILDSYSLMSYQILHVFKV
jgi:hypothetical protein